MNSNSKGKRGERKVRDYFREGGFTARRGQQFSGNPDSPDVVVDELKDFLHIEVKHGKTIKWQAMIDQARKDCGGKDWIGCVLQDRHEPLAVMPLKQAIEWSKIYLD